jgi:hypothetical protein
LAAGPPVATITSSGPIKIAGANVPTRGVPEWPLVAGDVVETGNAPALVKFSDGSRITLQSNSRFRLDATRSGTWMRISSGTARVDLSPKAYVEGMRDSRIGVLFAQDDRGAYLSTAASQIAAGAQIAIQGASLASPQPQRTVTISPSQPNPANPGEEEQPEAISEQLYSDLFDQQLDPGTNAPGTLTEIPDVDPGQSAMFQVPIGDGSISATFRVVNVDGQISVEVLVSGDSGTYWADVPVTTTPGNSPGIFIGY